MTHSVRQPLTYERDVAFKYLYSAIWRTYLHSIDEDTGIEDLTVERAVPTFLWHIYREVPFFKDQSAPPVEDAH